MKKIWMYIALILVGFSLGIITGVVIDADQVYHTTVKKLKQKDSPGSTIVVDLENPEAKSKREIRKEERQKNRAIRKDAKD